MSNHPNPRRRAYRRFSDDRLWREFFIAAIGSVKSTPRKEDVVLDAAKMADLAYSEYRSRFPVREPELDDEPAALDSESAEQDSTVQAIKKGVQ